jgi:PhnB protein
MPRNLVTGWPLSTRILKAHRERSRRRDTVQGETNIPAASAGYATVNPFVITHDADGLIDVVKQVFRATERPEARTLDDDGLLLHAELAIGNATVMFAERKPGWPFTPSLLQVYVDDVDATLKVARQLGATMVTEPTDFFGDTFSRFRDPWGNLWWVYRHRGQSWAGDEESADWTGVAAATGAEEWDQSSPGLTYIHDTLLAAMGQLQDPREATP